MHQIFLHLLIISCLAISCNGHGRLIEPPSRASAWRYGFNTPANYNDHELYCGGFTRQWKSNEGKCGECGDAFDMPVPRPHEYGGKYGQGVIVRNYDPGSEFTIKVELTASHMGYFEFRVCPDVKAKQDCLDKNVLKIKGGSPSMPAPEDLETRFYPRNGSRIYEITAELPADLKCPKCVLQWKYVAGNNWGMCDSERGAVGCGPQEEFRACSDIQIGSEGPTKKPYHPIRPIRPNKTTIVPPSSTESTPEPGDVSGDQPEGSVLITFLIIFLTLLLVLCILAAIYLYHYHGEKIKEMLKWKKQKDSSVAPESNDVPEKKVNTFPIERPPVPPPRTKRLSLVREMTPDYPSVA